MVWLPATDTTLEKLVDEKFPKEKEEVVLDVAKDFVEMCEDIGGEAEVDDNPYESLDMVCRLDNVEGIWSVKYSPSVGHMVIETDEGQGSLFIPEELRDIDMTLYNVEGQNNVRYKSNSEDFFGIGGARGRVIRPDRIRMDIYRERIDIKFIPRV